MAELEAVTSAYKNLYADRPNKRKVKPVNIEYLYSELKRESSVSDQDRDDTDGGRDGQEEDEEDDEDFEQRSDISEHSDHSSGASSGEDDGDDENGQQLHPEHMALKTAADPRINALATRPSSASPAVGQYQTVEAFLDAWRNSEPDVCCICLDDATNAHNPLMYCDGAMCELCVHLECYGLLKIPKAEEDWYCDRCAAPQLNVNGTGWAHVSCALWIPDAHFAQEVTFSGITADDVPLEDWFKECSICGDMRGVTLSCDAGNCRNRVHISCAANWGLLEHLDDDSMAQPHFVYCKDHPPRGEQQPKLNRWVKWVKMRDSWWQHTYGCPPMAGLEGIQSAPASAQAFHCGLYECTQSIEKLGTYTSCQVARTRKQHAHANTPPAANKPLESIKEEVSGPPKPAGSKRKRALKEVDRPAETVAQRNHTLTQENAELQEALAAMQELIQLGHVEVTGEGDADYADAPLKPQDLLQKLRAGQIRLTFSTKSLDLFLKALARVSGEAP
ncbi:hypothetical protein RI367_001748 [Sorochytrium milnesiophthora]